MTRVGHSGAELTRLLDAVSNGETGAVESLWLVVEDEVRKMAYAASRREVRMVTLQPTALVNEVFLRLHGSSRPQMWHHRAHFFGSVARAMSQILVDAARKRGSRTRVEAAREQDLTLQPGHFGAEAQRDPERIQVLLDLLVKLAKLHPRAAEVVRLRWIMGFERQLAADTLGVTTRTLRSDWRFAQAWLKAQLEATM